MCLRRKKKKTQTAKINQIKVLNRKRYNQLVILKIKEMSS